MTGIVRPHVRTLIRSIGGRPDHWFATLRYWLPSQWKRSLCASLIITTTATACLGGHNKGSGRKACEVVTKKEILKVFPWLTISDGAASGDEKSSGCLYSDAKMLYRGPQIDIMVDRGVSEEEYKRDRSRSLKTPNRKVVDIPHLGDRAYSQIAESDSAFTEVLHRGSTLRVLVMAPGGADKSLEIAKASLGRL